MSSRNFIIVVMLMLAVLTAGCTGVKEKSKESEAGKAAPVVGGVAVGVSPKVVRADRGEEVTLTVDLVSTENADDNVTVNINGNWIDRTMVQGVRAGANVSIPVHIIVPVDAANMTYSVKATSGNLNATSSSSGLIFINRTGGE